MAVPTGTASLLDIQNEFGGSNPISLSEYRGVGPGPASGAISINDFRGASNVVYLTGNHQQITASSHVSAGGTLDISASSWIWSDNVSVAALTIDIACTIINRGRIIGKGGDGGLTSTSAGQGGGSAISVSASGVSVTNVSGAYIAGGGGGGGSARRYSSQWSGGGGGAGGGRGGGTAINSGRIAAGGAINTKGQNGIGLGGWSYNGEYTWSGGEAGGHAAYDNESSSGSAFGYSGGGGGRILPGVATGASTGAGGGGGQAGGAGRISGVYNQGGGGGGWGAAGGNATYSGGSAGAAISGTSVSLSNSGTIYGAT